MNSSRRFAFFLRMLAQLFLMSVLVSDLLAANPAASDTSSNSAPTEKLVLRDHWKLQSSAQVTSKGEIVSTAAFVPQGWHDASVPTTVVAALVKDKTLPDPLFAMNLRQFAGVKYPIGGNFSNIAMPRDSPYAVSWWYREQFEAPASYAGKTVWLNFKGINYRANVWLNGKQIANFIDIAGAWRTYELNVTGALKSGGENVLAVQVFAPTQNDLAVTFVDWNPAPPDKNMGLWREVYFTTSGPVALRYPTVVSKLNLPATDLARLTVTAQVKNSTNHPVKGTLKAQITNAGRSKLEVRQIEFEVDLDSNEVKDVTLTPEKFEQLRVAHPQLWWPAQMGEPHLYRLEDRKSVV